MAPRATVLVVEDDDALRKVLELRLTLEGFAVATAADGQAALGIIEAARPDAAITDLMMPNLDGFGFCRALRRSLHFRELPIILLTAHERDADIDRLLELGSIVYMNKPFDARLLADTLQTMVASHREAQLRAS